MWNDDEIKVVKCPDIYCNWSQCPHKKYHNEYHDCITHSEICPTCEEIEPTFTEKDISFDL